MSCTGATCVPLSWLAALTVEFYSDRGCRPFNPSNDMVNHPHPRDPFTRRDLILLLALTLAGAVLRVAYDWGRPRLGDEVGTLINLRMDAGYLLTHFSGWLTMNYFILAEKGVAEITGSPGWPLAILPLGSAIATIPLTASLARRLGGTRLALVAATLTAFNPYLVEFSPVIRSYAPLAATAVWAVDLFFRWREHRTWTAGAGAAAVILLMLLLHPNGIYVVLGLGALVAIEAAGGLTHVNPGATRGAYLRSLVTFVAPLAVAGLATWLAYRRLAPDVQTFTLKWGSTPPTSLEYLPHVFATYFGTGFPLFIPGGLLLAGVWSATQNRKALLPLALLAGLSPLLVSLKGVSHFPWAYARFQIYCVPLLLILMAEGVVWMTARLAGKPARVMVATWALAFLVIAAWLPLLTHLFAVKRQDAAYAQTASYLLAQRRSGDLIVVEGLNHLQMIPLLPPGADGPIPAAEFVKKPGELPEGGRVFFVAPDDPPLGSPEARRHFGKLQVVVYDGPLATIRARLRDDLMAAAGERVDSSLGGTYQLLALLDKGRPETPGEPGAREWRLLSQLCQSQSLRSRYLPEQMRGKPRGEPVADTP